MNLKALLIILILIFNISCFFTKRIENAIETGFHSFVPDTCDIDLILDIIKYRNEYKNYPDNSKRDFFTNSLNNNCRQLFDSIHFFPYTEDSIDVSLFKKITDSSNITQLSFNKFRIKYQNDSINEINILEGYSIKNNTPVNQRFNPENSKMIINWKNDKIVD